MTKNILIGIGQITHRATTRMTIWSAGYKVRNIQPLEMEKALSQGADFVGEGQCQLVRFCRKLSFFGFWGVLCFVFLCFCANDYIVSGNKLYICLVCVYWYVFLTIVYLI